MTCLIYANLIKPEGKTYARMFFKEMAECRFGHSHFLSNSIKIVGCLFMLFGGHPLLAYAIVGLGAVSLFWLLRGGHRTGPATPAQQAADLARSVEKTDYVAQGAAPPVAQYVTTYVIGDDLFDDSFSIDSPSGEFLGECGVGISETIGVGDPKKVTAFEVWMFDKNDIRTVTKVIMSEHAFRDVTKAILSPHIGGVSEDAYVNMGTAAARNVR